MIEEFDQNVHFVEIDIEEDPEIAEAAGIMGTPCVFLFSVFPSLDSNACYLGMFVLTMSDKLLVLTNFSLNGGVSFGNILAYPCEML